MQHRLRFSQKNIQQISERYKKGIYAIHVNLGSKQGITSMNIHELLYNLSSY